MIITIKKHREPCFDEVGQGWYLSIPEIPGLGESGATELKAFEELIISLKVLLAYENNIELI